MELLELPNQKSFAERYDIAQETLSDWNKLIAARDPFSDMRQWMNKLSKNVVMAMYTNSLSTKNLNADRDRLNFLKVTGWSETMKLEAGGGLAEIIKKSLEKRNAANKSNHNG